MRRSAVRTEGETSGHEIWLGGGGSEFHDFPEKEWFLD